MEACQAPLQVGHLFRRRSRSLGVPDPKEAGGRRYFSREQTAGSGEGLLPALPCPALPFTGPPITPRGLRWLINVSVTAAAQWLALSLLQVLKTEMALYENLLAETRGTLATVIKAVEGVEPMSSEVRECIQDLFWDKVPQKWYNLAKVGALTTLPPPVRESVCACASQPMPLGHPRQLSRDCHRPVLLQRSSHQHRLTPLNSRSFSGHRQLQPGSLGL